MTNTETTTVETITTGSRLVLTKGCNARGLVKGTTVYVLDVTPMGAEFGHCAKVRIKPLNGFNGGKVFAFYARHANRLSDPIVRMNDGNPSHVIEARRAR